MIDFHAHILPGADHGCADEEMAAQQLLLAQRAGIETVVVTPHFYPQRDRLQEYLPMRASAFSKLEALNHGKLRLLLGAEVQLCPGLDHLEGIRELCIGQTGTILVELPPRVLWTGELLQTLQRMQDEPGLLPVLAHIDRYPPEEIGELFRMGLAGQVNAAALCCLRGKQRLLKWIDSGCIVALGSDLHATATGYRDYNKAIQHIGAERTRTLMRRSARLLRLSTPANEPG